MEQSKRRDYKIGDCWKQSNRWKRSNWWNEDPNRCWNCDTVFGFDEGIKMTGRTVIIDYIIGCVALLKTRLWSSNSTKKNGQRFIMLLVLVSMRSSTSIPSKTTDRSKLGRYRCIYVCSRDSFCIIGDDVTISA
jgi:hypothetical protein